MGIARVLRWLSLVALLVPAAPAAADDFRVQGGRWDYRVSGYQLDQGRFTDLASFAPGVRHDGFLQLEWEHRPSWWPDLAASYARISGSGSQSTAGTGIGPIPIPGTGGSTSADGDFRDFDATLRYAIALGPVQFSPGLSVKFLRGHVTTVDSSGARTERRYNETFPMLHAQFVWPIAERLRLTARGDWISRGGDQAWQYGASLDMRLLGPLGLYAGWEERRYLATGGGSVLNARLRGARYGLLVAF